VDERTYGTHAEVSGRSHRTATARDISDSSLTFGDTINHYHGATNSTLRRPLAIPGDLHDFWNRDTDLAELDSFLSSSVSICLIAGTAGVGKTALAIRWAYRVKESFPDGHLYIDLGGFRTAPPVDPHDVLGQFLTAVGVSAGELPDATEARSSLFRSTLAERRLLIVLDNAVSAEQVRPLLPGAGPSRVLITSRNLMEGLGLRESVIRHGVDIFPQAEAIAMASAIIGRERAVEGGSSIAEASQLCGSLPLAIRIFAERARMRPSIPLPDLVDDLRDATTRWRALTAGDIAVSKAFSASYEDLDPITQQVFRRLGWFPSPELSIGAATALAGLPRRTVIHALDELEGATLVRAVGPYRYRMHDLLHGFALEKAADEPPAESDAAIARLLNWYVTCAVQLRDMAPYEQSAPHVAVDDVGSDTASGFASYREALAWFQGERGQLVAVARMAIARGESRRAWQITAALSFAYAHSGHFDDWLTLVRLGLAGAEQDDDAAGRATLTAFHGMVCKQTGKYGEASEYFHDALSQYEASGDTHGEAWVQNLLGYLHLAATRLDQADAAFHASLATCRRHGLDTLAILPAEGLGCVARARGDGEGAMAAFEAALAAHEAAHDIAQQFGVLVEMAGTALELGRPDDGTAYASAALEIAAREDVDSQLFQGLALVALGDALRAAGQPQEAMNRYRSAASIQSEAGDIAGRNRTYREIASLYRQLGQPEDAEVFDDLAQSFALEWNPNSNP
jgi:tetratricopeptide (TPR) repeat protein